MPIYPTKTFDYNFDNPACYPGSGTTVTDLQGNLNLAFVGTPTFSSSAGNGSYFSFDASNVTSNHLASAFTATLNGSYNCSMSFCIRATDLNIAVYGGINSDTLTSQNTFRISRITDQYWYSAIGYAGENVTSVATPVNKWVVVTVTSDYTNNQIKTYINGSLVKTDAFTTTYSFSDAQVILGFLNSTPYFNASLGDSDIKAFSFWKNVVLTAPQVLDVASEFTQYTSLITEIDFLDPACFTNGGTAVTDLSASGNNWTLQNTSYTYNATFGSIALPVGTKFSSDNGTLFGTGVVPFTVSMWHYATASSQSIFYNGCFPGSGYFGPQCYWNGSNLIYRVNTASGAIDTSTVSINTWHMFTVEYDGTTLKIYIDGIYATGATRSIDQQGSIPYPGIQFNNEYDNSGVSPITLINIYDVAIGAGDILALYNSTKDRFLLVSSYDFSDPACYSGSGSTVYDLAGSLDLPISGASYVSDGQSSYFEFSGSSSYIGKTGVTGLGTTFSISIWSQTSVTSSSNQVAFFAGNDSISSSAPAFYYNIPTIGEISASFNYGTGLITEPYVLNTWENYVYTADGTTAKFYKNGVLADSVSQGSGNWPNGQFYLGYTTDALIGKIAKFDVYNVALGSTAILENYNSESPRFDNLKLSYDFSDVACYPGSGNTIFDLSGSGVNATITGATYSGTGQSKYFAFDGVNDIIVSNSYNQSSKTVFTYNIWSQFTSTDLGYITITGEGVLGPAGGGSPVIAVSEIAPNGEYRFNFGNGIAEMIVPGTIDTWQMLTITADGTTAKFYLNGTLVDSAVQGSGAIDSGPQQTRLGGFSVAAPSGFFDGFIGTFDYYDVALGSTAIASIYSDTSPRFLPPSPPVTPVLIGSYDFSDPACWPGTGDTVFDLTTENNDLGFSNPSGGAVTFGGTGQSKYASFNGDTTYLYRSQFSASGSTFSSDEFTLSLWHNYPNSQSNQATMIMGGNGAAGQGIQLQVNGSDANKITAAFGIEITEGGQLVGIANTTNIWNMSTVTGDGTTLKLYQNGALIGSTTQAGSWDGRGFIIGRGLGSSYQPSPLGPGLRYAGNIGIAEVYSGALGSTDISDLYDLQQPRFYPPVPPPENLVTSFDFSDPLCYPGTGNTIFDLSNTGLDLPIVNATYGGTGQSKYFEFNGTDAYIGKNGVTGLGNTFSVNMWCKYPSSATSLMFPFSAGTYVGSQGAGPAFALNEPSTNFGTILFNDGIGTTSFATIPDEWHNYTFTTDGTTVKAYIDGTLAASVAQGVGSWDNGGLYLGVPISTSGNFFPGFFLDGQIATFDVYNEALNSGAVTDIYDNTENRFAPAPEPPPSIVGGRQFNQGFNG